MNPSLNNSENNPDNSRKKDDNSKKNDIKGKEKKGEYIYTAPPGTYFEDSSLNDAFLLFPKVRQNNGDSLTKEQVQLLMEELLSMSDKPEELTAIVKKSAMNGWKSFYPLKREGPRRQKQRIFCLSDVCRALEIANVGNVKQWLSERGIRTVEPF